MKTLHQNLSLPALALLLGACSQPEAQINIDAAQRGAEVPSSLYGIFFEEINHAGDGGLYAELIQNRGFEDSSVPEGYRVEGDKIYPPAVCNHLTGSKPHPDLAFRWTTDEIPAWSLEQLAGEGATMQLTTEYPLNSATPTALKVTLPVQGRVALSNTGFWGINIEKDKSYFLRFNTSNGNLFDGKATIKLVGADGTELCNRPLALDPDKSWCQYSGELIAAGTDHNARFVIELEGKGTLLLDYVSLFPAETFRNRENGLRKDIAETLEAMRPAFVRWPGGCVVEGITLSNRIKWKETIGDPATRPGVYDTWGYRTTMGFGYHEFLQYCEDIGAQAMFVCNAGMSCDGRNGDYYDDKEVEVLIQDALDAIEYATGDAETTKWGAERAKNGHPAPFTLDYIEVGNENHSAMYAKYYNRFYKRIREAYPDITIITCLPMSDQLSWIDGYDMNDPHFYNFPSWFYANTDYFDKFPREKGHKTYVGEYACNMGVGSGNMEGALSEGAFMMGMERNSDLVTMTSYAPLMENTKCRMGVNLILVRNDDVIGRSSYWVERMFTDNRPDVNLATDTQLGVLPDKTTPVGGIGLGTYQTAAEYSNIRISVDGEQVYASDLENNPGEWAAASGDWKIEGGKLIQPDENGTGSIMLRDQWLDAVKSKIVSVEFDARKLGGKEGFVLKFGAKDPANCYQLTLGSFGNAWTIFQSVADDNAFVLNTDRPTTRIETGRTYHVKLVIKDKDILECWIDGRKDLTYDNSYVQRQYAIAGLDRTNGEVIVKVINAEDVPMRTKLNFRNAEFEPQGKRISLWANSKHEENTFEDRNRIVPVEDVFNNVSSSMDVTFRPQSMTVLRLKLKK